MRHRTLIVLMAVFVLALLPARVLAAAELDQQQTTYDGFSRTSTACMAQTFTAGVSGRLDRVSLYVRKLTDHPVMAIEIRDTLESGVPGDSVVASDTVAGTEIAGTFDWIDFEFATPPIIVAGTTYAIVAPPLGPMGPEPNPWGFEWGGAQQTILFDPYAGGQIYGAQSCEGPYGTQSADLAFKTFVDPEGAFQPDGRIRANFGVWTGGNVYNSTGDGQALSRQARRGEWVLFRISIQNDGFLRDRFTLDANGASVAGYRIRYFRGTAEITAAVVAGTYRTPRLGPGRHFTIEAWVKPKWTASQHSSVTRIVQINSVGDPTKVDAVRFTLQRK